MRHPRPADRVRPDAGFTLVELLVVIVILGILGGIAVPSFLNHRQKGWTAQLQVGLRDAATAELAVMATTGAYSADEATLRGTGGWTASSGVGLTAGTRADVETYCVEATHERLPGGHPWKLAHYDSELGAFGVGPCPGGGD